MYGSLQPRKNCMKYFRSHFFRVPKVYRAIKHALRCVVIIDQTLLTVRNIITVSEYFFSQFDKGWSVPYLSERVLKGVTNLHGSIKIIAARHHASVRENVRHDPWPLAISVNGDPFPGARTVFKSPVPRVFRYELSIQSHFSACRIHRLYAENIGSDSSCRSFHLGYFMLVLPHYHHAKIYGCR